ncbi:hypothetical protein HY970_02170 [Candidatus Kaiserbacteria bacterium]|nr:hypothetical protein [Candidatus Kaiserbacteria bacterium]
MAKYLIGAIGLVLIIGGGWYAWKSMRGDSMRLTPSSNVQEPQMRTYATSTFSVTYPADYTVNDSYMNDRVNPKKPIAGVKFTIPGSMASGTNLSADSGISVEWLPRAKNCTGDIYLADNVRSVTTTMGSTTYSVATTTGAGAGNFYEEMVYAISGSKPCTAVRYLIHSTNIGNYEPGTVREFDRNALITAFDAIRNSLRLTAGTARTTTTP